MVVDEEAVRKAWENECGQVTDAMSEWVRSTLTPLSSSSQEDGAILRGTGSFIRFDGMMFILTCKHVANQGAEDFGFYGDDDVCKLKDSWIRAPGALDAAIMPVPEGVSNLHSHKAKWVDFSEFAEKFEPTQREILFFHGFARENAMFVRSLDYHFMNGLGYSTQQNEAFQREDRFFYLHWNPTKTQSTRGTTEEATKKVKHDSADGYSGSLVWDTGYVRARQEGRDWDPEQARVCGQLVTWDSPNVQLVARRIEDVNKWLIETLRGSA